MEIRYLASGLPHFLRLLHISLNISFRIQPLSSLVPIRNKLEHFVAISLYNFLNILSLVVFWIKQGRNGKGNNYVLSFIDYCVWISFSITGTLPYVITLVYWAAVHDPNNPRHVPYLTMFSHGINAVFSLIDTLIVAIPVHVTHVVYLVVFCGIYAIFTYANKLETTAGHFDCMTLVFF